MERHTASTSRFTPWCLGLRLQTIVQPLTLDSDPHALHPSALTLQSTSDACSRLRSVAKKKILFDIYKGSTDRGGIDDPAANSSAHEYLRLCEQLGLLPRPLAFGRPNQKDLNLQGFGLYPRELHRPLLWCGPIHVAGS
eukprot:1771972-Rhodomonas_salina.2